MNIPEKFRLPFRDDKPFGALILLFFAVPLLFSVITYENFEIIKYSLWLGFLGLTLFLWVKENYLHSSEGSSQQKPGRLIKLNKPAFILLGLFFLFAVISTIFSADLLNSLVGFYYRFTNSLVFYGSWVLLVVLLVFILNRQKFELLAKLAVFDSLLISVVGIFQSFGIGYYQGSGSGGIMMRAPSLLGNPNFSTLFIVAALPYALYFFLGNNNLKSKIYYGCTIFFIVWSLAMMSSRGAWLGFAAAIAVWLVISAAYRLGKKFWLALVLLGVSAVITANFYFLIRPSDSGQVVDYTESNVQLRFFVWDIARQGMQVHPWTGIGLGNFHILYSQFRDKQLASEGVFDDAHNLFLQMGATGGLPMVASFLALILASFLLGLKKIGEEKDGLALAGMSGLSAFVITAAFTPVSIPCYLLLALILAGLVMPYSKDYSVRFPKALAFGTGLLGIFMILAGAMFFLSELVFYFGAKAYLRGDYPKALSYSTLAAKLNPTDPLFYVYRAGSEIMLNKNDKIISESINKVVSLHPKESGRFVSASNLYFIWYMHSRNGEHLNSAISAMAEALKKDPLYSDRYGKMALYYYQKGDLAAARIYSEINLKYDNKFLPTWILLAKIYQTEGKRDQAIYALEKAYKLQPTSPRLKLVWYMAKQTQDIKKVPIDVAVVQNSLE